MATDANHTYEKRDGVATKDLKGVILPAQHHQRAGFSRSK